MKLESISARLWLITAFIALALSALGLATQLFQNHLGEDYRLRQQLSQAQSDWLMLRSTERNFLHYKQLSYADSFAQSLAALNEKLDLLNTDSAQARLRNVTVAPVREGISAYAAAFSSVVALQQTIGLNAEHGLYGALRDSAHQVEGVVGDDPALLASLLMLRRHEKDFMLRRNPRYVARFTSGLSDFRGALFLSDIDNATKATLQTALRAYSESFNKLVQAEIDIGLDDHSGLIGAMRDQVTDADTVFAETFAAIEQRIDDDVSQARQVLAMAVLAIIVISVALLLYTRFRITRHIGTAVGHARALGQGQLDVPIIVRSKDEIGTLLQAMEQMRADLLAMTLAAQRDTAVKNALGELSRILQGIKDEAELAEQVLTHLASQWQAQVGALYRYDDEALVFAAGYGLAKESQVPRYAIGEALIGQAAATREMIEVNNAPADYLRITSGTGSAQPASILVIPLVWNDHLYGAVELGSLQGFNRQAQEYFTQANEMIAIALHTARTRQDMQQMLASVREQADVLEAQRGELTRSNQNMLAKTEALQASEEELRVQQEELQAQQEELRVLNEELEAQTRMMNDRTQSLEQRNRELERRLGQHTH